MFTKSRKYFIKTWPRFKTRMLSFAKKYNAPYQSQMLKDVLSVYSYPYSTGQKPSKEEFKKLIQAATEDKKLKKDIIKIRDKWVSLQRHLATKKTEDKPEMQFVVDEVTRLRAYLKQDDLDHFVKGIAHLDKDMLDVAAKSSKARKTTKKPKATTTHRTTKPKPAKPGKIIKKPSVSEIPPKPSVRSKQPVPLPTQPAPTQPVVKLDVEPAFIARGYAKPAKGLKEIIETRKQQQDKESMAVDLKRLKRIISDSFATQDKKFRRIISDWLATQDRKFKRIISDWLETQDIDTLDDDQLREIQLRELESLRKQALENQLLEYQLLAAQMIFSALLSINATRKGLSALPKDARELNVIVHKLKSNQLGRVYQYIRAELNKIPEKQLPGSYYMLTQHVPEHLWVLKFVDEKFDHQAKQERIKETTSPVTTPVMPHKFKTPTQEELSLSRSLSHTLSQEILKKSRSEIIREIVIDDTAALDLLKQDIAESLARAQDKELNLDDVEVQLAALKHLYHVIYYANIIGQGLEFASANVHSLENIKKYDKKQIGKLYKQIRDVFYDFNKCLLADKVKILKEYAAEQTWALMLVDKLHLAPEPKPGKKHS